MNNDFDNKNNGPHSWDFSDNKANNQGSTNQYNSANDADNNKSAWNEPQKEQSYQWNYDSYGTPPQKEKPHRKNKGVVVFASIMCAVLVAGMLTLSGYGLYSIIANNGDEENLIGTDGKSTQDDGVKAPALNNKPETSEDVISADSKLTPQQIAKKTLPTVVGIVSYQAGGSLLSGSQNQGSGIIITDDGYIVTNAHVVAGASGIKVVTHDGQEFSGRVIGADPRSDLAVVKVEAKDLPYAELGNSDELEIGEPVIAVGNPGGLVLAGSVTDGIVSALNRPIGTAGADTINCIQTNAAINPGNSGGALVNQYGQVVGINSSKIVYEGFEGLGFAISINEAQPIIQDLMEYGMVTGRVKIGVTIQEVDEYLARLNNIPTGIFVQSVDPNSDAAKQGVIPGDVITKVNGKDVKTLKEVRDIIDNFKADDVVTLTIYRSTTGYKAKELEIDIKLMVDAPAVPQQEGMQ
ncbi:MAG: trypsin-like peptidase domain-containing protein [Oscillospiraceae bacterium]